MSTPVSYSYAGAAEASGVSIDLIKRAVRAGDITVRYPSVGGKSISKPLIEHEELFEWVRRGATDRRAS